MLNVIICYNFHEPSYRVAVSVPSDLAEVYNELLTQGSDGQELYVLPSELVGGSDLSARTIGEVRLV